MSQLDLYWLKSTKQSMQQNNKERNSFSIDAILSDKQSRSSSKREASILLSTSSPLPVANSNSTKSIENGIPTKRPSPFPFSSVNDNLDSTTDSLHHLRQLAARSIFHTLVLQHKQEQQLKVGRTPITAPVTGGVATLPTETRRQKLRDVTSSLSPKLPGVSSADPAGAGDGNELQRQQQQHQQQHSLLQKMYESRLSAAAAAAVTDGAWRYGLGTTVGTGFPLFPPSLPCVCGMASCRQPGHDSSVTRPLLSPVSGSVCDISNGGYSTLSGAKSDLCVPIPIPMYLRTRTGHVVSGSVRMRKCRRSRTVFSELQLMGLEKRFDTQKYLSTPDRADLGKQLGLSQLQVKTWYQNRRMKWKRQILQNGGTEPPTRPKGRPKKLEDTAQDGGDKHDEADDANADADIDCSVDYHDMLGLSSDECND